MGLKYSKGSRHATQRYSDLQAVEPNADRRSVCALPQRGQATLRAMRRMGRNVAPTLLPSLPPEGELARPRVRPSDGETLPPVASPAHDPGGAMP